MSQHPIPNAALDDRFGIVGTAGSGKTYGSGTAVERILARGGRCLIFDPLGVWYGLRLTPDGKSPSPFHPVIFGGEHADLTLNERAGGVIGEAIAGMGESAIIDLSAMGTKAAERRFMLGCLTALYRHSSGEPVHLIFDEADMWAPQKLLDKEGESAKLLGMMETIVRRGRVKGFIPWLITQRPAVLSKDVLSQVDGLVAFKLTASQDRAALGGWIEGAADRSEGRDILNALPALPRGEGYVWSPARGILERSAFPAKQTFDSSRTPTRGEKRQSRQLAALDLGVLKDRMVAVEAEAKANDPAALRKEVAELRRQIATAKPAATHPDPKAIEDAEKRGFTAGVEATRQALIPKSQAMSAAMSELLATVVPFPKPTPVAQPIMARPKVNGAAHVRAAPQAAPVGQPAEGETIISPSARKVLDEIHRSFPVALSFEAAALRVGLSRRSSAYRLYRQQVEASPEVERRPDGRMQSAPGFAADVGPGIDPVAEFASRLPPSYAAMLRAIAESRHPMAREEVAAAANVSPTSSGLASGLRELSALGLVQFRDGQYSLHPELKEERG